MNPEPIIFRPGKGISLNEASSSAVGHSFIIHQWQGSGPPYMHVHYEDDEAWHILEGTLSFSFPGRQLEVTAGTTIFVPAGLPHTYTAHEGSRYLMILTPRLDQMIGELHKSPLKDHAAVMKKYRSEILAVSG